MCQAVLLSIQQSQPLRLWPVKFQNLYLPGCTQGEQDCLHLPSSTLHKNLVITGLFSDNFFPQLPR